MAKERILILDKERIGYKLQRMAYQVWEHNSKANSVILVGVEGSGLAVAQSLARRIKEISPLEVEVLTLSMNKKKPLSKKITVSEDISGRSVVLVDDVANSGKTLLYALRPLLDYELKSIQVAVLVDRKHKSFPVSPDIVGHTIATTLQEHIEVETNGDNIEAAYLQ